MLNETLLDRLYYTTSTKQGTGISRRDAYETLKKELETLDLVWLWLHNRPLSEGAKQQIKERIENDNRRI